MFNLPTTEFLALVGAAMLIPQVLLNKMGPWGIFDWYERKVKRFQALHCPICLTFWLSLFMLALRLRFPNIQIAFLPFGIAGWALWAGVSLQAVITRDEEKDNGEQV